MADETTPQGRAPKEPGRTRGNWGSLSIPQPLMERLKIQASREGVSVALIARRMLESALVQLKTA